MFTANTPLSAEEAVQKINGKLADRLQALSASDGSKKPAWLHGVTLASQLSLDVLDILAPGHPVISIIDTMGHAVTGYFLTQSAAAG